MLTNFHNSLTDLRWWPIQEMCNKMYSNPPKVVCVMPKRKKNLVCLLNRGVYSPEPTEQAPPFPSPHLHPFSSSPLPFLPFPYPCPSLSPPFSRPFLGEPFPLIGLSSIFSTKTIQQTAARKAHVENDQQLNNCLDAEIPSLKWCWMSCMKCSKCRRLWKFWTEQPLSPLPVTAASEEGSSRSAEFFEAPIPTHFSDPDIIIIWLLINFTECLYTTSK